MNKKENNLLTKKDFEKILCKAMEEQAQTIIEAVDFGFEKAKEDRNEIKNKLSSLERRVIYIEDVITKHSKELKEIRKDLKELKSQERPLLERVALLEKKVIQLEARVA
ncbi:hypothetical protein KJ562_00190 [Patescibacteria group bacterium]|nr:hypothetical protein [Patescibacteria group bacterium]